MYFITKWYFTASYHYWEKEISRYSVFYRGEFCNFHILIFLIIYYFFTRCHWLFNCRCRCASEFLRNFSQPFAWLLILRESWLRSLLCWFLWSSSEAHPPRNLQFHIITDCFLNLNRIGICLQSVWCLHNISLRLSKEASFSFCSLLFHHLVNERRLYSKRTIRNVFFFHLRLERSRQIWGNISTCMIEMILLLNR